MKKISQIIMASLLVIIFATGTAFAETSSKTVNLVLGQSTAQINGKDVMMAAPAQAVSGTTLVPLRFISEAFGSEVAWDGSTKTATVILGNHTIEVPIGQKYAFVNGGEKTFDVPGQLIKALLWSIH